MRGPLIISILPFLLLNVPISLSTPTPYPFCRFVPLSYPPLHPCCKYYLLVITPPHPPLPLPFHPVSQGHLLFHLLHHVLTSLPCFLFPALLSIFALYSLLYLVNFFVIPSAHIPGTHMCYWFAHTWCNHRMTPPFPDLPRSSAKLRCILFISFLTNET